MPKAIAQDVKAELLDAAGELVAEVGWGRVSSRMVAERAGVNNALVHYHFGSMEQLLREAATQRLARTFAEPTRRIWYGGDVARGMARALRWLGSLDTEGSDVGVMAEAFAETRRDPTLREMTSGELERMRDDLADALGGGREARGVAILLLALLDGLLVHRVIDPGLDLRPAARPLGAWLEEEDG